MKRSIRLYHPLAAQEPPFAKWLRARTDLEAAAIEQRLDKLAELGPKYACVKSLGGGLWELKIGKKGQSAMRVYLSFEGNVAIVLYGGSSKKDQDRQIAIARQYLKSFKQDGGWEGSNRILRMVEDD